MDPAEAKMLEIMSKQTGLNELIDRGDSEIQSFYKDTTVFVTGGFGFIGKQLVEKLFRSCAIKKMYLLTRPKKGKSSQERLQIMLKDPVFESLLEKQPSFADKIVTVDGDIADIRLGISNNDWNVLSQEVNVIFHVAATLRFNSPLREATFANVRGTREVMTLARECEDLKSFVYVSTVSTHMTTQRNKSELLEQFYPTPLSGDLMIRIAEELEEKKLVEITQNLIKDWPNTYSFTKALAEDLIERTGRDLPICVVRPPLVTPSYLEPAPGWLESSVVYGPIGIIIGVILGVLHVFPGSSKFEFTCTPVDFVNNSLIAAGWDTAHRKKSGDGVPVYTVANSDYCIDWAVVVEYLIKEGRKYSTPKAVWYSDVYRTKNKYIYKIMVLFVHYIPAYIFDMVCTLRGTKLADGKSVLSILKGIHKVLTTFNHFIENHYSFHDERVQEMMNRMSDADKMIYNCDFTQIDIHEYIVLILLGIRKYVLKDGLEGTEKAYKRQMYYFRILNYVLWVMYIVIIGFILYGSFYVLRYVSNMFYY